LGEPHILFEKEIDGVMKRRFNAMEIKEDYNEGEIIYWKCISPDFLSETQTSAKRKPTEEIQVF
jgi:hypothetical protein